MIGKVVVKQNGGVKVDNATIQDNINTIDIRTSINNPITVGESSSQFTVRSGFIDVNKIINKIETLTNSLDTPPTEEYIKDYIYINENIHFLNVYYDSAKTNLVYSIEYTYDSDNLVKKVISSDKVVEYNYIYENDILTSITKNIIG
jgi:hypothetical protein